MYARVSNRFLQIIFCLVFLLTNTVQAQQATWSENANWQKFDSVFGFSWNTNMGDWVDAQGSVNGDKPFAETTIDQASVGAPVLVDITVLFNRWHSGQLPNHGILIKGSLGTLNIAAMESDWLSHRPRLIIETSDGASENLFADKDTYLDRSTLKGMNGRDILAVSEKQTTLIGFPELDMADSAISDKKATPIKKVLLSLHPKKLYGNKAHLQIYAVSPGQFQLLKAPDPESGLRQQSSTLKVLKSSDHIFYVQDFEESDPLTGWKDLSPNNIVGAKTTIRSGSPTTVAEVTIGKNANLGVTANQYFKDIAGRELNEAYFQYSIMLGDNWSSEQGGGKLPGLAGTYNVAGWGGRQADGYNGWSMRGLFRNTVLSGYVSVTPVGFYAYHAEMDGKYGEHWVWVGRDFTGFEKRKWYVVEQHIRMNSIGLADGIIEAWVDGQPVFSRTDVVFRKTEQLKLERVWLNIYHGGVARSQQDQDVYIDNLIVADQYIGLTN
ncbi:hypothetical protein OLMES_2101 [Oleiphilus messinensis]|uniref:Polysaccharide lyase 14 domain-containing protein n=1 Tax=Oleiphilus messinensis TaxID=141451 RepID=A0A1Y0I9S0_9GAMM|nr:hypothetical protein [Oleiphilus messinensis]ARU56174.1 hypothetical protein OLMES_2101 [Oleiphilus messinensis]